jgi:Holliday junction resolvase
MAKNSRAKGVTGEREFSNYLKERGIEARRAQQFCGRGGESADVLSSVKEVHWEVKRVEAFSLYPAVAQAKADCKPDHIPIIAHRRNRQDWVAILEMDQLLRLLKLAGMIEADHPLLNLH